MKKYIHCLMATMMMLPMLSGCGYVDYDGWNPEPPYGWDNTFCDQDLTGCWQLYQINSEYVSGDAVNFMQFNGDGRGYYYYYDRGYREEERIAYWCQHSVSGSSALQVNIQYEYGRPSTMNYWFTDRYTLWMQWRNSYGVQTYVYKEVPRAPW